MYGGADGLGVRPGEVVIDGGAHVGLFTRTALALGASKVITFEVDPNAVRAQRKNLEKEIANGRMIVLGKAVWFEGAMLPLAIVERCPVCNSVTHKNMQTALSARLRLIDRLTGSDKVRLAVEAGRLHSLLADWDREAAAFLESRKPYLLYR